MQQGVVELGPFRFRRAWTPSGWALLLGFWGLVLALIGGGTGLLAWLGPPAAPQEVAEAAAPSAVVPGDPAAQATAPAVEPQSSPDSPGAQAVAAAAPPAASPDPPSSVEPATLAAGAAAGPRSGPGGGDPALLEDGPHGPLPRIGPQGRTAIRTYGRPFDRQDRRPRIGLVIGGLGMNAAVTEEAIRRLPGTVTLAFSPYAPRVELLLEKARAKDMEILVALPLEPTGHPTLSNAGDRALLTGLPPAENADRLDWALSRFAAYVGAIGALGPLRGQRFSELPETIGALQDTLRGRGLLYIDPRPPADPRGPARAPARAWGRVVDILVDEPATRGEIDRKLVALERLAQERLERDREPAGALGYAGEASPVLVDRIAAWAGGLEARGLVLAPVTAMLRQPEAPAGAPTPVRTRGGP